MTLLSVLSNMLSVEQKGNATRAAWDGIYRGAFDGKAESGQGMGQSATGRVVSESGEKATHGYAHGPLDGPLGDAIDEHFRMHVWNFGETPDGCPDGLGHAR